MTEATDKEFYEALAKAIAEMPDPKKNAKNDHFRNSYADLGQVLDCIRDPLQNNGLLLIQYVSTENGADRLTTELVHAKSGVYRRFSVDLRPESTKPQALGSCITYMRRYTIKTLFGMFDVDDDGNKASLPTKQQTKPQQKQQPRKEQTMPPDELPVQLSLVEIIGGMRDCSTEDELHKWVDQCRGLTQKEQAEARDTYRDVLASLRQGA